MAYSSSGLVPGQGHWASFLLDRFVAPECSILTSCDAPELPALPNYFATFFLNNVFVGDTPDSANSLTVVFLRRLAIASREYTSGREQILEFIEALPRTNTVSSKYLRALSHFEQCVIAASLALLAHGALGRTYDPNHPEHPYVEGDGSPAERLKQLYNSIKHFDEWIEKGKVPKDVIPVWITPRGLRSRMKNSDEYVSLQFDELINLLKGLELVAKWLAEDVFRVAHERKQLDAEGNVAT